MGWTLQAARHRSYAVARPQTTAVAPVELVPKVVVLLHENEHPHGNGVELCSRPQQEPVLMEGQYKATGPSCRAGLVLSAAQRVAVRRGAPQGRL